MNERMNTLENTRRRYEEIHYRMFGIPKTPEPQPEVVYLEEVPSYREIAVRPHIRRVRC